MRKIGAEPVQGVILMEIPSVEDSKIILSEKQKKEAAKNSKTVAEGLLIMAVHPTSDYKVGERVIIDADQLGNIILKTSEGIEQFYMSYESAIVMKIVPLKTADLLPQN